MGSGVSADTLSIASYFCEQKICRQIPFRNSTCLEKKQSSPEPAAPAPGLLLARVCPALQSPVPEAEPSRRQAQSPLCTPSARCSQGTSRRCPRSGGVVGHRVGGWAVPDLLRVARADEVGWGLPVLCPDVPGCKTAGMGGQDSRERVPSRCG